MSEILYEPYNENDSWKLWLAREIKNSGIKVDMSNFCEPSKNNPPSVLSY